MYVSVYVCICICMYLFMYVSVYVCICICMYFICMYLYMYLSIYVCICICMYLYMYVSVCTCLYMYVSIYLQDDIAPELVNLLNPVIFFRLFSSHLEICRCTYMEGCFNRKIEYLTTCFLDIYFIIPSPVLHTLCNQFPLLCRHFFKHPFSSSFLDKDHQKDPNDSYC